MSDETTRAVDEARAKVERARTRERDTRADLLRSLGSSTEALVLQQVRTLVGSQPAHSKRVGRDGIQELRATVTRLCTNHIERLNTEAFDGAEWPTGRDLSNGYVSAVADHDVQKALSRVQQELANLVARAVADYGFDIPRQASPLYSARFVPEFEAPPEFKRAVAEEAKALNEVNSAVAAQERAQAAHEQAEATSLWDQ